MEPGDQVERLLTVDEAAALLQVSPRTVYEWVERGMITHLKLGRLVRFSKRDLMKFMNAARQEAHQAA